MLYYNEAGYLDGFLKGLKDIKAKYSIEKIALAYVNEGIAEFVMLPLVPDVVARLNEISHDILTLVNDLSYVANFSTEVFTEVSSCDLDALQNSVTDLFFV